MFKMFAPTLSFYREGLNCYNWPIDDIVDSTVVMFRLKNELILKYTKMM